MYDTNIESGDIYGHSIEEDKNECKGLEGSDDERTSDSWNRDRKKRMKLSNLSDLACARDEYCEVSGDNSVHSLGSTNTSVIEKEVVGFDGIFLIEIRMK